jgi:alpha-tubulin suppressor-like RCC1 family protein
LSSYYFIIFRDREFYAYRCVGISQRQTGMLAILGGYAHSLAMKSDGTVSAWESNGNGQLGEGLNSSVVLDVKPSQFKPPQRSRNLADGLAHLKCFRPRGHSH